MGEHVYVVVIRDPEGSCTEVKPYLTIEGAHRRAKLMRARDLRHRYEGYTAQIYEYRRPRLKEKGP